MELQNLLKQGSQEAEYLDIVEALDKALDIIVELHEDDPEWFCEELHSHSKEEKYCSENCNNFNKECVKRYLKYYKKEEQI